MSGPVMSSDDFWQPFTEKQTLGVGNEGTLRWLHLGFGFGIASICVALMVVLAPFTPVTDVFVQVTDCSDYNAPLLSSGEELSTVNESGIQDGDCPHDIEIASWNLEVFGQSKANNPGELSEIAEKISNYDIVAVQEIKDKNPGTAPYILQDEVEKYGEYGMVLSNRTGSFCEENPYASEQYAFFYNNDTIKQLESEHHYPDIDCDFSREPFAARFQSSQYDYSFVLITLHVKPDDALNETKALVNVFEWAKFQYPAEEDFILLGDLNADCSYARSSELDELAIRNGSYQWIIPDGTNTNTAESSSCAYDRMIIGDGGSDEYLGSFSTDCELEASDHCIISARFSAHESSAVSS